MSFSVSSILDESRTTFRLAIPLIIGQLGQMLIGLSDTLMLGWLGVTQLAASSFANTIIYLPMMVGIGMSMAVSIRVSQARGAEDPVVARAALRHGLYITFVLGLLTIAMAFALLPFLHLFKQDPAVVAIAPTFFVLIAVSMVPAMTSMAVKSHADAMNRPWPVFWISLGGVFLDIFLNWVMIFGKLGFPALGLEGAAISTIISRALVLGAMIFWCVRDPGMKDWVPQRWFRAPDWPAVKDLLRTGFPASMQLLAEVSAFVMATFIIGNMGQAALASHQVAITCAATIFMVPLGISMALTVRMGEAFGAKNRGVMRNIVLSGWLMGIVFTVFSAASFVLFNHEIASAFIKGERSAEVLEVAAALLIVAAAFQFCDALQIISAGALRGLDDVHTPAWIAFWAYWVVSIPLGWALARPLGWGVTGMWWGITVGLTMTCILLGRRIWLKTARVAMIDDSKREAILSES
ncbi:MATE family efflux transporter [Luteolibacter sp. GHJ8]|uniref:Multidrug-efflux transporter n=1 Tax=Luteolibacter rhizosphaerae TaxID=2989719 RepID=A0ABT3G1L1_9BACT|nr:MATE family efflux transporter [Luteolibacter rhizosphaerae]MCW1913394.1 MATE family efflux transporter [Luteolibacter rhizosphaerae]